MADRRNIQSRFFFLGARDFINYCHPPVIPGKLACHVKRVVGTPNLFDIDFGNHAALSTFDQF